MIHSFMADFIRAGERLDYRQSFARAAASYATDRNNALVSIATGKPRFDYNASGVCKGVLIEPAATNYALYSQLINNASGGYTQTGLTAATTGVAGAPDSTSTVTTIQENTSSGNHSIYRATSALATLNQQVCVSIFLKYVDATFARLIVYDSSATINYFTKDANITSGALSGGASAGNGLYNNSGFILSTTGWNRFYIAGRANTSGTTPRVYLALLDTAGTSGSYVGTSRQVKAWGFQTEVGNYPTSYIPTTSAAVTRPADVLKQTLGSWWNSTKGTLLVDFTAPGYLTGSQYVASIDDGTANNKIELVISSGTLYAKVTYSGTEDVSLSLGALTSSTDYRVGFAFTGSDFSAVLNGGTAVTDASGTVPTVTTLRYGCDYADANQLNGTIGRVMYWPTRLSNTTLQAMTK